MLVRDLVRVAAVIAAAVVVITALATSASAQPAPGAPPPTEETKAKAKALVAEGIAADKQKSYDQAITLYQQAYDLIPHPSLLFNIGLSHESAGRFDDAARFYQRYLEAEPSGAQAAAAREHLASIQPKLTPAPAPEPKPEPAPAPAPPPEVAPPMPKDIPADAGRSLRIAGLAVGGVGIAWAGAAIYFGLKLESIEKDQLKQRDMGLPYEYDQLAAGQRAEFLQNFTAVLAGSFIVGGAALYWVGHRRGRAVPRTAWRPVIGTDGAGIVFTGALP